MPSEIRLIERSEILDSKSSDLIYEFLRSLDMTPTTIRTYHNALIQFKKWLSENKVTNPPTRDNIIMYRDYLRSKYKATTTQNYIVALKRFFSWLYQTKGYPNIAEKIKGAKISSEHKKDYLPADTVKRILANIPKCDIVGMRDFALLSLMAKCGLRICEITRANVEDLKSDRLFIQGKGKDEKSDFVKVPHLVELALRNYLSEVGGKDGDPLFVSLSNRNQHGRMTTASISRIIKTKLRENGYDSDRLTAHSLRHTAITLSLLNGATLQQAQQLARHTNINTTMIYAHNLTAETNPCVDLVEQAIGI